MRTIGVVVFLLALALRLASIPFLPVVRTLESHGEIRNIAISLASRGEFEVTIYLMAAFGFWTVRQRWQA